MKKIILLVVSCLFAVALDGQEYENLDYKSYKLANEILQKTKQLDYDKIQQLGYTLKGSWYSLGHYSTPEERVKLPTTSKVFAANGGFIERESQISLSDYEDDETMIEYYSADTCYVLHYGSEECSYGEKLKKESNLIFFSPVTILWDMYENRHTIRYLGLDSAYSSHVISYLSSFNKQVSVFIDMHSFTITMAEVLKYSDIRGDYLLQFIYEDYERLGTYYFPSKLIIKEWGDIVHEMTYRHTQATRKKENDITRGYSFQKISDHLYVISYSTGKHFSYVIDFGSYLGVIEAPVSRAYSAAASKILQGEFKSKPIKYLFLTHHHPDHAGGFAYYYQRGATVVTTPLNQDYQQTLLAVEHSLCKDCYEVNGVGDFIAIPSSGDRSFSTDTIKMMAYEFGDNGHTKEFLFYYFPESKILITGDLFYTQQGSVNANKCAEKIINLIREKGLEVEKIYPTWLPLGYKRFSTFTDLEESAKAYNEKQNQ